MNYQFPSHKYVTDINYPITIFHGTRDNVISYGSGERLFRSIAHNNKTFISIKNGGHNDLINFDSYRQGIRRILP